MLKLYLSLTKVVLKSSMSNDVLLKYLVNHEEKIRCYKGTNQLTWSGDFIS